MVFVRSNRNGAGGADDGTRSLPFWRKMASLFVRRRATRQEHGKRIRVE